jgi:hypothetical protein
MGEKKKLIKPRKLEKKKLKQPNREKKIKTELNWFFYNLIFLIIFFGSFSLISFSVFFYPS